MEFLLYLKGIIADTAPTFRKVLRRRPLGLALIFVVAPLCIESVYVLWAKRSLPESAKHAVRLIICDVAPWFLGALGCYLIVTFFSGPEASLSDALLVAAFSHAITMITAVCHLLPLRSAVLFFILLVWQGIVFVIGMREAYSLRWLRAVLSAVVPLIVVHLSASYAFLFVQPHLAEPDYSRSDESAFVEFDENQNLLINGGFEAGEGVLADKWTPAELRLFGVVGMPSTDVMRDPSIARSGTASGLVSRSSLSSRRSA